LLAYPQKIKTSDAELRDVKMGAKHMSVELSIDNSNGFRVGHVELN